MEIVKPPELKTEAKTEKSKDNTKFNKSYIKFSFTITYILLLTTGTITFIEALRTKTPYIRHIFNLETCISIIAGYFYGIFIAKINQDESNGKSIDWNDITQARYIDWSITTPLMLLALCLVLSSHIQKRIHVLPFLFIIALNYVMLTFGFLGEIGFLGRIQSDIYGFIAFFAMFATIFYLYVFPKYSRSNYILFFTYFFIWSLYGIVYLFDVYSKNILTNFLDLSAKCFVGLGLWVYYTRIIV